MFSIFQIPGLGNSPQINFGIDATPRLAFIYDSIVNFFKNKDFSIYLTDIKVISGIISAALVITLIMIIIKMRGMFKEEVIELEHELNLPEKTVTLHEKQWQEIKNRANSLAEADWKLAVIEADKFVDDALKKAGYEGESMGERLMMLKPDDLINLQNLWDAHKLRNLLVHDPNYKMAHRQAILAMEAYEGVLRELGVVA